MTERTADELLDAVKDRYRPNVLAAHHPNAVMGRTPPGTAPSSSRCRQASPITSRPPRCHLVRQRGSSL